MSARRSAPTEPWIRGQRQSIRAVVHSPCSRAGKTPGNVLLKEDGNKKGSVDEVQTKIKKRKCQTVYKPGFVVAFPQRTIIHLERSLPNASSNQPEPRAGKTPRTYDPKIRYALCGSYSVLLRVGFSMPFPLPETRCALTAPFHLFPPKEAGSLFSVALSFELPQPDVIRHPFPLKPGLSSPPNETNAPIYLIRIVYSIQRSDHPTI